MGLGLGDILGSISPAFGLISGNGLFGSGAMAPMFGATGLALDGNGIGGAPKVDALSGMAPVHASGPSMAQIGADLPTMASQGGPDLMSKLGGALQGGGGNDRYLTGMQFAQAPPAQQMGMGHMLQLLGIL